MRVREIMTENPCTCTQDTSIEEIARMMQEHDCGAIPVIEGNGRGRAIGIITDRDIVMRLIARGENPMNKRASDAMTSDVVTVSPDESVEDLAHKMEQHKIRRVVVAEEGRCIGMVAQADVARRTTHDLTAEVVEEVSR